MSMWSRLKSLAGGDRTRYTLASAAALAIPDDTNFVTVTGTTAVTSLSVTASARNREITILGGASAAVSFTNTNSPSAGQMYLRGSDRLVSEDVVLKLLVKADGTVTLISFTG